jgi:tetratricopeptide (TPR) repeat protein
MSVRILRERYPRLTVAERSPLTSRLVATLREEPTTLPAALAVAIFVAWSSDQAGYPVTHWAPGGLVLLGLLAATAVAIPPPLARVPRALLVALGCLAAYTALSFLSIAWAGVGADAWDGANRTLLYLVVFALFALWPQRGGGAVLLLGLWLLAMIALGAFVLAHLDTRASLVGFFKGDRLAYPGGYENASAATWGMAMWPALLLAASRALPWMLRGVLAGGVVLLAGLALLSQSRGSLFSTPIVLALVFAFAPGRLRTFAVLVPIAAGVAASAPFVLHVGDALKAGHSGLAQLHRATVVIFLAAALAGAAVALGAAIESRRRLAPERARALRRGLAAAAVATAVGVLAGAWVAAGDPAARVSHAWKTFTSTKGYGANGSGNRLLSGFGSNRYDFYRVALDQFTAHPLVGIGADNFAVPYLAHAHSNDSPRYPHSLELRTLAQTGVIGALIALAGLAAALAAAFAALRPRAPDAPLARAVAAAALSGFAYWLVHGSVDWFWEFAGLGAPAFALLGLACALAPRSSAPAVAEHTPGRAAPRPRVPRQLAVVAGSLALLVTAASLTLPWLSQLELEQAARVWPSSPSSAYGALGDAADLDPLADEPYVVAGNIAVRLGDLPRADHEFALALRRNPHDAYATLERGAIASALGERARALHELSRTLALAPHEELAREALAIVRRGRRVDVAALNLAVLHAAAPLR